MKKIGTLILLVISLHQISAQPTYNWSHVIGSGMHEAVRGVAKDDLGNFYLIGDYYGTVDMDQTSSVVNLDAQIWSGSSTRDIMVAKYSSSGTLLWAKSFGNIGPDIGYGIAINSVGDVFITGGFSNTTYFGTTALATAHQVLSCFVAKLESATGNVIWATQIGHASATDFGTCIAVDIDDNVYVGGTYTTSFDIDPGSATTNLPTGNVENIFVAKFDTNGGFIWGNGIAGSGSDNLAGLTTDSQGNLIACGNFYQTMDFDFSVATVSLSAQHGDGFIWKLGSNGSFKWVYRLGGNNYQSADAMVVMSNDEIAVTGTFMHHITIGANLTVANNDAGNMDGYILKLDSAGVSQGIKGIGGSHSGEALSAITKDQNGNIYVTGGLGSSAELNSISNSVTLASAHGCDPIVIKYDNQLNYQWHYLLKAVDSTTSPVSDYGKGIAIVNNDIFIGGFMNESLHKNFAPYADTLEHVFGYDGFIHKVNVSTPLPLQWGTFNAYVNMNNQTELKWTTQTEINTLAFEIEKSTNTKTWTVVGKLNARGYSEMKAEYSFVDPENSNGVSYYRIKQIDMDHHFTYSNVEKVMRNNQAQLLLYPNPCRQNLYVSMNNLSAQLAIEIFTLNGKSVLKDNITPANPIINLESLTNGTYFIKVYDDQETNTLTFIKE